MDEPLAAINLKQARKLVHHGNIPLDASHDGPEHRKLQWSEALVLRTVCELVWRGVILHRVVVS